jgi:putative membrane protein
MHEQPPTGPPADAPVTIPFNVQTHLAWLRTRLAVERTIMAWNRTSLSLIGFGFTIYQFFDKFQEATVGPNAPHPRAPRLLGIALVLAGTLGTLMALYQYREMRNYLQGEEYRANAYREGLPRWSLTMIITVILAVIGIATTLWLTYGWLQSAS